MHNATVLEFQAAVCAAFGLDPLTVADIDLTVHAGQKPTATVRLWVRDEVADRLTAVLRRFHFAPDATEDAVYTAEDSPSVGRLNGARARRLVEDTQNTDGVFEVVG